MNNAVQTPSPSTPADTARQQEQQRYVVPPVDVFENESSITLLADLLACRATSRRCASTARPWSWRPLPAAPGTWSWCTARRCPAYRRQFTLSRELDTGRIEAQLRDGVLRLTIPKAEAARRAHRQVLAG